MCSGLVWLRGGELFLVVKTSLIELWLVFGARWSGGCLVCLEEGRGQ